MKKSGFWIMCVFFIIFNQECISSSIHPEVQRLNETITKYEKARFYASSLLLISSLHLLILEHSFDFDRHTYRSNNSTVIYVGINATALLVNTSLAWWYSSQRSKNYKKALDQYEQLSVKSSLIEGEIVPLLSPYEALYYYDRLVYDGYLTETLLEQRKLIELETRLKLIYYSAPYFKHFKELGKNIICPSLEEYVEWFQKNSYLLPLRKAARRS